MLRGPGGQSVYFLETAALFTPHMVDLHGCFTLCYQIQVLLGQVGPQLPDLKLTRQIEENLFISLDIQRKYTQFMCQTKLHISSLHNVFQVQSMLSSSFGSISEK